MESLSREEDKAFRPGRKGEKWLQASTLGGEEGGKGECPPVASSEGGKSNPANQKTIAEGALQAFPEERGPWHATLQRALLFCNWWLNMRALTTNTARGPS